MANGAGASAGGGTAPSGVLNNPQMWTVLLEALGRGFAPNNPMAPAARAAVEATAAQKAKEENLYKTH